MVPPSTDEPDRPAAAQQGPRGGVETVAERLLNLILSGELATGTWLRQERLANEFGVSRTPVREALRTLQARGLVEMHPHRGALICGPTARDIREAYAVRAQLEGYAAELAAEWSRDDDVQRLADAAELFERLVEAEVTSPSPHRERPRWQEANDRFHEAVLDAAGNQRLKTLIEELHQSFPRNLTWSALSGHPVLLRENVAQHREVMEALRRRDASAARRSMVAHVERAGALVLRRFEEVSTATDDTPEDQGTAPAR